MATAPLHRSFGGGPEGRAAENSEVLLLLLSVAVAVTNLLVTSLAGRITVKVASPLKLVTTLVDADARNVAPWPCPEASGALLAKNSSRKLVNGVLLRVPWIVAFPAL